MSKNDWSSFGEDVLDLVQKAVENRDYIDLNESISKVLGSTKVEFKGKELFNGQKVNQALNRDKGKDKILIPRPKMLLKKPKLYIDKMPNRVSSIMLIVFGIIFIVALMVGIIVVGLLNQWTDRAFFSGFSWVFVPFMLLAIWMTYFGSHLNNRNYRFKQYVNELRGKEFIEIEKLANRTKRSVKFVKKDLKDLIQRQYFLQGHLDSKETLLITSDSIYAEYQKMEESVKQQEIEANRYEKYSDECRQILEEGRRYINRLDQLNDVIVDAVMSQKLDHLKAVMEKIFASLEKSPDLAEELQKFINYYLPTTMKLVEAYHELDVQPIKGENISKTKKEIEDSLDTINQAFENLLDSLFEEQAWDISSDISVLKTMFAQEGLMKDELKQSKER